MRSLIRRWGKDDVVNVGQRANLYKTIRRLLDAGMVTVRQTERNQRYPERTVYQLTDSGRRAAVEWLSEMLATPRNEFPQFPAALSFVMLLPPEEALGVLEHRAAILRENVSGLACCLDAYAGKLPRVTLLDNEYMRAVTAAELGWLTGVIDDLRRGELTWTWEELTRVAIEQLRSSVPGDGEFVDTVEDQVFAAGNLLGGHRETQGRQPGQERAESDLHYRPA